MPGTAYVLFHHVMGECDGVRGVWGYVRGGMGALSNAIAAAARAHGAEIKVALRWPMPKVILRRPPGRAHHAESSAFTTWTPSRAIRPSNRSLAAR